jgi:hypothetical protein
MEHEEREFAETTEASEPRKKPYASPRLTSHGDAREITRALGGTGDDGQTGSQQIDTPP